MNRIFKLNWEYNSRIHKITKSFLKSILHTNKWLFMFQNSQNIFTNIYIKIVCIERKRSFLSFSFNHHSYKNERNAFLLYILCFHFRQHFRFHSNFILKRGFHLSSNNISHVKFHSNIQNSWKPFGKVSGWWLYMFKTQSRSI